MRRWTLRLGTLCVLVGILSLSLAPWAYADVRDDAWNRIIDEASCTVTGSGALVTIHDDDGTEIGRIEAGTYGTWVNDGPITGTVRIWLQRDNYSSRAFEFDCTEPTTTTEAETTTTEGDTTSTTRATTTTSPTPSSTSSPPDSSSTTSTTSATPTTRPPQRPTTSTTPDDSTPSTSEPESTTSTAAPEEPVAQPVYEEWLACELTDDGYRLVRYRREVGTQDWIEVERTNIECTPSLPHTGGEHVLLAGLGTAWILLGLGLRRLGRPKEQI